MGLEDDLIGVYLPAIDEDLNGIVRIVGKRLETYLYVVLKLALGSVVRLLSEQLLEIVGKDLSTRIGAHETQLGLCLRII